MENITRSEFEGMQDRNVQQLQSMEDRLMGAIQGASQGINARLDALNGKTNKNVTEIAVLQDRQTRDPHARWGAGLGVLISVCVVLWKIFGG